MMSDIASYLEHTLLQPDTTLDDVKRICNEGMRWKVATVCIPPFYVRDARRIIPERGSILIATVVGFPMGYTAIAAKAEEIKRAVDEGVNEVDAVVHIAAIKSGNWTHVARDADSLARAAHLRGQTLKLILECGILTDEEIRQVCAIASDAGISFLKTGTGFFNYPATPDMVTRLAQIAGPEFKIKASGGIRTAEQVKALIEAGASRIGTSAAAEILKTKSV